MHLKIFIHIPPRLTKWEILEFIIMVYKNPSAGNEHGDNALIIINGDTELVTWIVLQE